MSYAVAFRDHKGPIQNSLRLAAKDLGMDVLVGNRKDMNIQHDWDSYETLIWFDNRVPTLKTSAKLFWWMCDLRSPSSLDKSTTADYIGLCNKMFMYDYESLYGVPTVYVPQCGNDTETTEGRKLACDALFLGHLRKEAQHKDLLQTEEQTRQQVLNKEFHWNRYPVIAALQDAGLKVKVISREGATIDSKYLYYNTPINLSISLPVPGYTSNRLYNILSSEGFCLAAWFPGLEDLFENHKHLVWFKTCEEAVDQAEFYLRRPDDRRAIAKAGHEEYLLHHSARSRLETMLRAMS